MGYACRFLYHASTAVLVVVLAAVDCSNIYRLGWAYVFS